MEKHMKQKIEGGANTMEGKKQKVRKIIVARNTIEKMRKSGHYTKNEFGMKYLNEMAGEVFRQAGKVHPLLPYYLAIRAI